MGNMMIVLVTDSIKNLQEARAADSEREVQRETVNLIIVNRRVAEAAIWVRTL